MNEPDCACCHDNEKYQFDFALPGVGRKDIDIQATEEGFCLKATRDGMDYSACYPLSRQVDTEKVKATYKDGLLRLEMPLKNPVRARKIAVN